MRSAKRDPKETRSKKLVCRLCVLFIHPAAEDDEKIYNVTYEKPTDRSNLAHGGQNRSVDDSAPKKDTAAHPFKGF